ncbi:SNF2 family N-terminal domain containing protein [Tritrichomonas foetus]|uniref:SNF2 family N-terminal domain containing protein n=1 Tax=Tritrichomonas foetus TaxID=1144522 RepID=A0A1J4KVT6_9EUKA|nr:SNF2 family N-terminal domain containing protein [Tritrichomonas foetus]|eukprot:OHT13629.1 SNF2 family N-terminal domain containing protein [Tritrichomonas foetus]
MKRRTAPKRRGRRPPARPDFESTSENEFDFGETSSSADSSDSSDDHYLGEEEEETENKRMKKSSSKELKQLTKPKHTALFFTATQITTEDETNADSESVDGENGEDNIPLVQQIVGVKGSEDINEDESDEENPTYYVKWTGKSYIHCSYVQKNDLMVMSGGENAIKKFNNKKRQGDLSQSLSIPSLMTLNADELSANWFEVDRVIAHDNSNDKYLVKWRGQGYDMATWEDKNDIPDKTAIEKYEQRLKHSNPIKIDEKHKRNVDPKSFVKLKDPLTVDDDGNQLRDYQVDGVNWLRYCWYNSINSILADEMGLGKTLQIVTTLNDISFNHNITGPFLVIAPLSTLPHWRNEFERWTKLNVIIYHGGAQAKEVIQRYEMFVYDSEGHRLLDLIQFDVLITNYETFMTDFEIFQAIEWRYLVLDEGHRLKNHSGKCYQLLQQIQYEHCTLLTGTPVQNNVEELWSLLHFLHPNRFGDLSAFLERFGVIEEAGHLKQLQELIKPYMLRRKKSDVDTTIAAKEETIIEVELTRTQKTYYGALLHDNAGVLLTQITGGALPSLLNLMMQLRKVCNHPFLLKGATNSIEKKVAEKLGKPITDEEVQLRSIVDSSGKLILIDKLLPKLQADGHKVLIFSQMVRVLDILDEYFALKGIKPERIDGSVPENERQNAIERFAADPNAFVFLLCTRAGGVGINLTAADTVIIYDSDWNPQNDLQAESRCHRIGQKSKVKVYRLVTRGTYELEMLDRASKKLGLDHAILDGGEINSKQRPMAAKEVEKLLRSGVYNIANDDDSEINNFCAADIDQILDKRSKSFTRDVVTGGDSYFAKAKFDAEGDTLDMNSKDFWSKALPEIKLDKSEEELTERRCKKKSVKFNDLSDDDDDKRRRKKISSLTNPTPRAIAARIMHQGFCGSAIEKALILYAAKVEPLAEEDKILLMKILDVTSLEDKTDDILNAEKKFSTPLEEWTEKKDTLFKRIFFFYNLHQVLTLLQQPIDNWPVSKDRSGVDPMVEYALLFGIYKNGLGQSSRVLEGVSLEGPAPVYTDKMVQKISRQLVLQFLGEAQTIEKFPKSFLGPKEWKEDHMNIFNRLEMTDEEFISLFQTLTMLGFPEKSTSNENHQVTIPGNNQNKEEFIQEKTENKTLSDETNFEANDETIHNINNENIKTEINSFDIPFDKIDWEKLRHYSVLTCIALDTVIENGLLLYELANDKLEPSQIKRILQRLGPYGNKVWITRLKANVHDLSQIRRFLATFGNEELEKLKTIKEWDSAPEWWNWEYDLAMLKAINDIGLLQVSTWIVDPERPFAEKLNDKLKEDFSRCADFERTKFRPQKPKDPGDFAFLYMDKTRIIRANYILSVCYKSFERFRSDESENNNDDEYEIYQSEFSELPSMPLELGNTLTIFDLGKFDTPTSSVPVGFKCNRQYFSIRDPSEKSWYEGSTTRAANGDIKYIVKHLIEPEKVFTSHTSSGVWEQVIQEVQKARGRAGLQKRKHTTVSGPFMFGFSNSTVASCFKLMKSLMEADKDDDYNGDQTYRDRETYRPVIKTTRIRTRNTKYVPEPDDDNNDSDREEIMPDSSRRRRRGIIGNTENTVTGDNTGIPNI